MEVTIGHLEAQHGHWEATNGHLEAPPLGSLKMNILKPKTAKTGKMEVLGGPQIFQNVSLQFWAKIFMWP